MNRKTIRIVTAALAIACALSCGPMGRVEQGRVVEFDATAGLALLVLDSNHKDSSNPKFDVLPAEKVRLPASKEETGPLPDSGKLLSLDCDKQVIVVFDSSSQALKTVPIRVLERHDGVRSDDPRVAGARLPVIDRRSGSVTVYEPRRKLLATVAVAAEYLDLPPETWRTGDEVRYYYKEKGQALRLMNVTKTNLSQAGR